MTEPCVIDTHVDSISIIKEVKARPALYDKSLKEYNDCAYRKELWEEIFAALYGDVWHQMSDAQKNLKGLEITKRWNNIRTCFTRELKYMKNSKYKKRRKYLYFDKLLFLTQINKNSHNMEFEKNNITTELDKEENNSRNNVSVDSEKEKSTIMRKSFMRRPINLIKLKQRKANEKDLQNYVKYAMNNLREDLNEIKEIGKNKEEKTAEYVQSTLNTDPDTNFALSLVPALKNVPLDKKLDLQIEILSIIKNYTKDCNEYNVIKFEREDPLIAEVGDEEADMLSSYEDEK